MSITVTPLSAACGAEISGIDLREPLDASTVKEIEDAFHEHVVVVFRGQDITEEEQMAFANAFGGLGERRRSPNGNTPGGSYDTPFMFVTNIIDEKTGEPIGAFGDGEMWFHHDTSYYEKPHKATLLYSITLPNSGGNTCFANMYKAYENVPADLKAKLEGRKVLQLHDYKRRERIDIYNSDISGMLQYEQPIFVTHPVTRRKALYISRLMSAKIEGLAPDENEAILNQLFDISEDPSVVFEHVWKKGDMVMWDNYASIHMRRDFPRDQPRLMRRLTLGGYGALN
ncbi:MAG: TauD/TfdA family dioxygenase [Proteobacteria bacterium]|nr:TauD/TfdA family dioxygenase [Pseudomonadota bacterium]MDA1324199.1 TauD/TfdA family dioxygenase [Pseudomonadota bacterium]